MVEEVEISFKKGFIRELLLVLQDCEDRLHGEGCATLQYCRYSLDEVLYPPKLKEKQGKENDTT